jgi:DNA repair exonuclease SbcCD ATPase subunit
VQRKLDLVPLIDAALAQVKLYPNVNGMLQVRRTYEAAIDRWVSAQTAWEAEQARRACLQTRLATMFNVENALEQVRTRYMACHFYEMQVTQHSVAAAKYAQGLALVATAKAGAAEYRKAREALVGLKATVKSHLVPSLNKVASVLLSQMTGGVRNVIAVDEDFNIKVDGQALDELSGSAKAVANLAIRIGLGQVLTNRVFGVLLGDELDAAMDEERGGFTADCLRGLTGRIPQVILVTHKRPEADAYIELEQAA